MAGLSVAESMTIATGLTAIRVAVDRFASGVVVNQPGPEAGARDVAAELQGKTDQQVAEWVWANSPNLSDGEVRAAVSAINARGSTSTPGPLADALAQLGKDHPGLGNVATIAQTGGEVAKIVTAGALVTLGLLVVERGAPELARGLAVVVLVTSALVHGVRLAEIAISATR